MQIVGERRDGVLLLNIGGGQGVLMDPLRQLASKVLDLAASEQYGPWLSDGSRTSLDRSQRAEKALQQCRGNIYPHLLADLGYDDRRQRVSQALRMKLGVPISGMPYPVDFWDRDLNDEYVIYTIGGKTYRQPYAIGDDGNVSFTGAPEEVTQQWVALKPTTLSDRQVAHELLLRAPEGPTTFKRLLLEADLPASILEMKGTPDPNDKAGHPFTWCKNHVIPAMAAKGKAPSDENAFCAWWKENNASETAADALNLTDAESMAGKAAKNGSATATLTHAAANSLRLGLHQHYQAKGFTAAGDGKYTQGSGAHVKVSKTQANSKMSTVSVTHTRGVNASDEAVNLGNPHHGEGGKFSAADAAAHVEKARGAGEAGHAVLVPQTEKNPFAGSQYHQRVVAHLASQGFKQQTVDGGRKVDMIGAGRHTLMVNPKTDEIAAVSSESSIREGLPQVQKVEGHYKDVSNPNWRDPVRVRIGSTEAMRPTVNGILGANYRGSAKKVSKNADLHKTLLA